MTSSLVIVELPHGDESVTDPSKKPRVEMSEMFLALKPGPFIVRDKGDPELLLKEFVKYKENFKEFLVVTKSGGKHTAGHAAVDNVACEGCTISKACLRLMGGEEMKVLFEHVGKVEEGDTFEGALEKIENGVKKQTNQSAARFKLMQQYPQGGRHFAEWFPKVKEQADRISWEGYDAKMAARDAILYQTDDKRLQKKILTEDMSYDDTVKYGLAMEQNQKKVEEIRGVKVERKEEVAAVEEKESLEELVRSLRDKLAASGPGGGGARSKGSCRTCPFPTHKEQGKCPGKSMECFACQGHGHMKGSAACSQTKGDATKKKKQKARNVKEESSDDTEDVGRVKEESIDENKVRAVGEKKSEEAKIVVTSLSSDTNDSKETEIKLLIDSGVNRSLLSEQDWRKVKLKDGRSPVLKKCDTKF